MAAPHQPGTSDSAAAGDSLTPPGRPRTRTPPRRADRASPAATAAGGSAPAAAQRGLGSPPPAWVLMPSAAVGGAIPPGGAPAAVPFSLRDAPAWAPMPHPSLEELRGALLELGVHTFHVCAAQGPSGSYLAAQIPIRDSPAQYAAWVQADAALNARAGVGRRPLGMVGPMSAAGGDPAVAAELANASVHAQISALERMVGTLRERVLFVQRPDM